MISFCSLKKLPKNNRILLMYKQATLQHTQCFKAQLCDLFFSSVADCDE